jgi:hypothetical protein
MKLALAGAALTLGTGLGTVAWAGGSHAATVSAAASAPGTGICLACVSTGATSA